MKKIYLLVFMMFSCSVQAEQNAIIASVNGEPITVLDVVLETGQREAYASQSFSGIALEQKISILRNEALESIITRRLIYAEYTKQAFNIPVQYIEDAMDDLASSFGGGDRNSLKVAALRFGTTMETLKEKALEKVAVEILINEHCRRPSYATPKRVYDYYSSHKNLFSKALRYKLYALLINEQGRYRDNLNEILELCTKKVSGVSLEGFKALVLVYSEGVRSVDGGDFGWVKHNDMRPAFLDALNGADTGNVVQLKVEGEGTYFFYLAAKDGGEVIPFKKVQLQVKKDLERSERVKLYNKYIEGLKRSAVIRRF